MFDRMIVQLISWVLFASSAIKFAFRHTVNLQIHYLGMPRWLLAEVLVLLNATVVTVLIVVLLYKLLVQQK